MQSFTLTEKSLPVADLIRNAFRKCTTEKQTRLLGLMSEEQFIADRVNTFFIILDKSLVENSKADPQEAELQALNRSIHDFN